MATNRTRVRGRQLYIAPTDGGVNANDPGVTGQIPFVTLVAKDSTGNASVDTLGVYNLSVKGVITGPANSAVAAGDIIYYNSGHTPKLDKDVGGVRFGYALGALTSGSTGNIDVRLGY